MANAREAPLPSSPGARGTTRIPQGSVKERAAVFGGTIGSGGSTALMGALAGADRAAGRQTSPSRTRSHNVAAPGRAKTPPRTQALPGPMVSAGPVASTKSVRRHRRGGSTASKGSVSMASTGSRSSRRSRRSRRSKGARGASSGSAGSRNSARRRRGDKSSRGSRHQSKKKKQSRHSKPSAKSAGAPVVAAPGKKATSREGAAQKLGSGTADQHLAVPSKRPQPNHRRVQSMGSAKHLVDSSFYDTSGFNKDNAGDSGDEDDGPDAGIDLPSSTPARRDSGMPRTPVSTRRQLASFFTPAIFHKALKDAKYVDVVKLDTTAMKIIKQISGPSASWLRRLSDTPLYASAKNPVYHGPQYPKKPDPESMLYTRTVRVLYRYHAEPGNDDLDLRPGDIITVWQEDASGWWYGELNGKRGLFPLNYTEPVFDRSNSVLAHDLAAKSGKKR